VFHRFSAEGGSSNRRTLGDDAADSQVALTGGAARDKHGGSRDGDGVGAHKEEKAPFASTMAASRDKVSSMWGGEENRGGRKRWAAGRRPRTAGTGGDLARPARSTSAPGAGEK
jgi:hypothetical protein